MEIQVENKPKSTVELTISVKPDEYNSHLVNTAKRLSSKVKIDGFRAGNVPYDIMVKKVGETEILNESLNDIITETFVKAIEEKKLDTIGQPEIKITKIAPGNDLEYKAIVILIPNIELPDLDTIEIKKENLKIENSEIDHTIAHLAKSRAKQTLVDAVAAKKHLVKLDYNISIAGVPQEGGQQKDFEAHLGDSHMVPGFEENIIGTKAGTTKKFDVKFPADYFQKNFAGKTATFDVKISGVYELDIPEINDELASSLGNFKNVDELKKQIEDNIKAEKETELNKKTETDMLHKIIEKTKFEDIPDKMIENEINAIVHEIESDLAMKGLKMETWLENMKKTMDQFKADLQPQAITRVKSALIVRAVAHKENIKVDKKEVASEIEKLTKAYKDNPEIEKQINNPSYQAHLENVLNGQKVMNWLKKKIVK
jgi:trigger factor